MVFRNKNLGVKICSLALEGHYFQDLSELRNMHMCILSICISICAHIKIHGFILVLQLQSSFIIFILVFTLSIFLSLFSSNGKSDSSPQVVIYFLKSFQSCSSMPCTNRPANNLFPFFCISFHSSINALKIYLLFLVCFNFFKNLVNV